MTAAGDEEMPRAQARRVALGLAIFAMGLGALLAALVDLRGVVALVIATVAITLGSILMARAVQDNR